MIPEHVVKRPIFLTEKGSSLQERQNQYTFEVDLNANKIDVRLAIEKLFNVGVASVNTMVVRGRPRRMGRMIGKTRNWKKAIVTLNEGDSIEFFEGA